MKQDTVGLKRADYLKIVLIGMCLATAPVTPSVAKPNSGVSAERAVPIPGQTQEITGTVTDASGTPVIGAMVLVDGTNKGAISGLDGSFTLKDVAPGEMLHISFVGYVAQRVAAAPQMTVTLETDNIALDEVVVIGYGGMNRRDVSSSVATIQSDELNVGVFTSPAQLLQGKVAGLAITQSSDPNATASVTLRGASTLRGGAAMEPYYVVDGIPGVSLAMIAPDNIESIDVLRDASATAIYGSKAANGVIIVTTKRGGKGERTSVSYNGYAALDRVAKRLDMLSADAYRKYVLDNGFSMEPAEDHGANTNWQREVQRTGVSMNHNVSLAGNTEKSSFAASVNYAKNQGVVRGTDQERFIGRTFVETKTLGDRLRLSMGVNASLTLQNDVPHLSDGRSVYDAMIYFLPYSNIRNADGTWWENPTRSQYYNPVSLIEENTELTKTKRVQGIGKASLRIVEG